ncbi:hypothetical protein EV182_000632, partial [Spiromyces aspiralis]
MFRTHGNIALLSTAIRATIPIAVSRSCLRVDVGIWAVIARGANTKLRPKTPGCQLHSARPVRYAKELSHSVDESGAEPEQALKAIEGPLVRSDKAVGSAPRPGRADIKHDISLHKPTRHGRARPELQEYAVTGKGDTSKQGGSVAAAIDAINSHNEPESAATESAGTSRDDGKRVNEKGEVILGYSDEYGSDGGAAQRLDELGGLAASSTHEELRDVQAGDDGVKHRRNLLRKHHFDTFKLVERLSSSGLTHGQAVALTYAIRTCIADRLERLRRETMTRSDLENELYLYRSYLEELRTEIQVLRKNDQFLLQSDAASIEREVEALASQMKEDMASLRSDIQIDMNTRKHEHSDGIKKQEMMLHDMVSMYQVVIGDMRTDIESVKLESIRKGLMAAVTTTLVVIGLHWFLSARDTLKESRKNGSVSLARDGLEEGGGGNGVSEYPKAHPLPIMGGVSNVDIDTVEEGKPEKVDGGAGSGGGDNGGSRQPRASLYRNYGDIRIEYEPKEWRIHNASRSGPGPGLDRGSGFPGSVNAITAAVAAGEPQRIGNIDDGGHTHYSGHNGPSPRLAQVELFDTRQDPSTATSGSAVVVGDSLDRKDGPLVESPIGFEST